MNKKWTIERNKNGSLKVIEQTDGPYETREEAVIKAKELAKDSKTILKVYNDDDTLYETSNYTSILSPTEWSLKLKSDFKIAKAEYLISKKREKDLKTAIKKAHVVRDIDKERKLKIRLNETILKKRRNEINYREARQRLQEGMRTLRRAKRKQEKNNIEVI
ncbi:hypothetical protein [Mesoplasma lactucae]|uniref:Uncharacterized protein n=1 Tax=Mesoplasma lactucae ATCC 49193 TaxID=81460 RepID=A0A291IRG9_9MOLU|nr:hypothetical protein [Mesoplasma lactucae]ATG97535.1 hypothetical protein CP520_02090 [Mesoplasma lactucae ATCC 49193]ATZ20007.1 hypothetical protein MLACT_v1c01850 [Mesoplasma lactucae ATCC 49193]MCL8217042.1 hypothetical protein [Mesoplasma lactucae ATCC 49193]